MLQQILDYLNNRSNNYNYCCDILGNYIYNIQSDVITKLKQVDDSYALITSERGKDIIKMIFNNREEALLMTLLFLEKNRYFDKTSRLISNHKGNKQSIMEHAKDCLVFASPELDTCKVHNFCVTSNQNNCCVIFNTYNKKYKIMNTNSDELWAYQVAFNYSLELDNYYSINKELLESNIIAQELDREYLYNFLELNKYEEISI